MARVDRPKQSLVLVFAPALAGLLLVSTPPYAAAVTPAQLAAHKQRLAMTQPPEAAEAVLEVRKKLEAAKRPDGSAEVDDVVVAGHIGGMPNLWGDTHPDYPWYADQASFFVVDNDVAAQLANHAKHHGGDVDCPFCRRLATRNVNAVAVVNLVDDQGNVIPADARELLGLKEGQTVLVRGSAELLGGSFVVINAGRIYVRSGQ